MGSSREATAYAAQRVDRHIDRLEFHSSRESAPWDALDSIAVPASNAPDDRTNGEGGQRDSG